MRVRKVVFELDEAAWQPLNNGTQRFTYVCGFCGGNRFDLGENEATGWISEEERKLCCSEPCARMFRRDPDPNPPRFIDDTWLNEED